MKKKCPGLNDRLYKAVDFAVMVPPLFLVAHYHYGMFGTDFTPGKQLETFLYKPVLPVMHGFLATLLKWSKFHYEKRQRRLSQADRPLLDEDGLTHSDDLLYSSPAFSSGSGKLIHLVDSTEPRLTNADCLGFMPAFLFEVLYRMKTPVSIFGGAAYLYTSTIAPQMVALSGCHNNATVPVDFNGTCTLPQNCDATWGFMADPRVIMGAMAALFLPAVWALKIGLMYQLKLDRLFNPSRSALEAGMEVVKTFTFQVPFVGFNALFFSLGSNPEAQLCTHSALFGTLATLVLLFIYMVEEQSLAPYLERLTKALCCLQKPKHSLLDDNIDTQSQASHRSSVVYLPPEQPDDEADPDLESPTATL